MCSSPLFRCMLAHQKQFVESSDGKTFDITSPATLKHVAKVYEASEQDTDRAVASAKAAFPSWSALSPAQRAPCLKKLASLIRESNDELASLEAASMGKPIGDFFEGMAAASKFDYYSEAGHAVQGTTSKCLQYRRKRSMVANM